MNYYTYCFATFYASTCQLATSQKICISFQSFIHIIYLLLQVCYNNVATCSTTFCFAIKSKECFVGKVFFGYLSQICNVS